MSKITTPASRRSFLTRIAAVAAAGVAIPALASKAQAQGSNNQKTTGSASAASTGAGPFTLPALGYAHNALEPHINAETMEIHHGKHHAGYVTNLNKAIEGKANLQGKSATELIKDLDSLPEDIRTAVRNNGGGHVNHTLFWELMTPGGAKQPSGDLAEAIQKEFGSFDEFKTKFNEAGGKRFGSGWVWLIAKNGGDKLEITSTANQDSPLMEGDYPLMGNDVWEHAYYLTYRNRRPDYLKAWWNVVNWDKVAERYAKRSQG